MASSSERRRKLLQTPSSLSPFCTHRAKSTLCTKSRAHRPQPHGHANHDPVWRNVAPDLHNGTRALRTHEKAPDERDRPARAKRPLGTNPSRSADVEAYANKQHVRHHVAPCTVPNRPRRRWFRNDEPSRSNRHPRDVVRSDPTCSSPHPSWWASKNRPIDPGIVGVRCRFAMNFALGHSHGRLVTRGSAGTWRGHDS